MIGFFEEALGERSMTRLVAFLQTIGILLLCIGIDVVALVKPAQAAGIIAAMAAVIAGLAAGVWKAISERV